MKKLTFLIILCLNLCSWAQSELNIHPDLLPLLEEKKAPFYHGVASGDPTQHSVMLWTKLTLPKNIKAARVQWELALDAKFKQIVLMNEVVVSEADDFCLKVDVKNLEAGTAYYYRFKYNNSTSVVGQTLTFPDNTEGLGLGFASCSNYEWGYFNNYRFMAKDEHVDVVVHLGDYIYEYAPGGYGDTTLGRKVVPSHEIVSLMDYRTRYSLYRLDPDLQLLHQLKPFITTWDDHEITNNAYDKGAQNHQDSEGDYQQRKLAARKAYYEWLPVRKKENDPLYRSFNLGNLGDLIVLDTRLEGRTVQVDATATNYEDSTRHMLGTEQMAWFKSELMSTYKWKIVANQVPFGPLILPDSSAQNKYMDGWDGYPADQSEVAQFIHNKRIRDVVFMTGDYHSSLVFENRFKWNGQEVKVADEFVVGSITSANLDEYYSPEKVKEIERGYRANNPTLEFIDLTQHGYATLVFEKNQIQIQYKFASTIRSPKAKLIATEPIYLPKN